MKILEYNPRADIFYPSGEVKRQAMVIVLEYVSGGEMFDFILNTGAFNHKMT